MTRRLGPLLLILPVAAVLPAALAQAQSYPPPGSYRADPPPPPPGYYTEDDGGVVVVRPRRGPLRSLFGPRYDYLPPGSVQAEQVDAEGALPPPGLPAVQGQPGAYGHQFDSRAQAVPGENIDPNAIRPPAAIGAAPPAAPGAAPQPGTPNTVMTLPPEDQPETGKPKELPENLKKQLVDYTTKEPAGTLIVDTANTYLYLVLGNGKAMRYGIGVGREGFTWTGTERVSRMKEWPDWFPPTEMIERQPYLPRMMAGGPGNPLGARALYLGKTLYRIHGTNQPSTIGSYVSSGCIRLLNGDIEDLYSRVQVGTRVVVLPGKAETVAASGGPAGPAVGAPTSIAPPAGIVPPAANAAAISSSPLPPVR